MTTWRKPPAGRYGTHPINIVVTAPTLTQNQTTKAYVAIPARCYVSRAYLLNPGTATTAGTATFRVLKYVDDGAGDRLLATVDPELAVSRVPRAFTFDTAMSLGDRSIATGGVVTIAAVADNNVVTNGTGLQVVLELMVLE
jgi:hypothetical protein